MRDSKKNGGQPLRFDAPVEITTEPGTYRGVRSQRVRLGRDVWLTAHEDGRLTLGSYSVRFRLDALLSSRGGSIVSLSTEPIAPAEQVVPVDPIEEPKLVEEPAEGLGDKFTWTSLDGITITYPEGQEPENDPPPMVDHMGRAMRVGDQVRQMGYWHGGRRRDVGRVGRILRITRAGTAEVQLDATRDLPADVRNLGSTVLRRIDAGEPVEALADDPAEESGQ